SLSPELSNFLLFSPLSEHSDSQFDACERITTWRMAGELAAVWLCAAASVVAACAGVSAFKTPERSRKNPRAETVSTRAATPATSRPDRKGGLAGTWSAWDGSGGGSGALKTFRAFGNALA